ncbi:M48 family metallopeptidase [Branchiibius cervicis]|uniref:M48 family metallopeptidase n=1 Tax=Branchiibius cervicis TaxID=908252 RepID=A0ABW2AQG2_9MICO
MSTRTVGLMAMSTPIRDDGPVSPAAPKTPVRGDLLMVSGQVVEVRRSARRRRTINGYRADGRIIVLVPAGLGGRAEAQAVADMVQRVQTPRGRRRRGRPDQDLMERAAALSRKYLADRAHPESVRWVGNQRRRWGSCTPSEGTIRLSTSLQGMPAYVIDSVLLHELAHLLQPGHGRDFWALLAGYPDLIRAQAYLDGVEFGSALRMDESDVDAAGSDDADGLPA